MKKRKKRLSDEINLTPLLDVLFSILFIVMLTGAQSESSLQQSVSGKEEQIEELSGKIEELESQQQVSELEAKIAELEAMISELKDRLGLVEDAADSEKMFETNAVIVNVYNYVEEANHYLKFYVGDSQEIYDFFRMGVDKSEYIQNRVAEIVGRIVSDSQAKPVFVVFRCDKKNIYRKEECIPIINSLENLRGEYKEVFYQVVEE